jgi:hypothetical protein
MAAKYRQSYAGVGELLRSEMMYVEMIRRAHDIADEAERTAPTDPGSGHTGRYKAGFVVDADRRGGFRGDRAVGRVVNDTPEAIIVEFGNRNTPQHATMRNALRAAGD